MTNIYIVLGCSFLISLLLGMFIIPRILFISYEKRLFDIPDERKVHDLPVPRLGGLSFFPAILIASHITLGFCWQFNIDLGPETILSSEILLLTAGCMILFLAGVSDDLVGISYKAKFLFQFIAAALLVSTGNWFGSLGGLAGIHELPDTAAICLTMFFVVYLLNAINLIDGIDGLASGLSGIGLITLSALFIMQGQIIIAMLSLTVLGVIIPFWFYNVFGNAKRGHKLFMGDVGSLTLGFLLSILIIHECNVPMPREQAVRNGVLAFTPMLIPMFDVVRVTVRRLYLRHNPFLPDKNHFHHKLLRTGLHERQVMLVMLIIAILFLVLNYLLTDCLSVTWIFVIDVVLWVLMHLYFDILIHRRADKAAENEEES